jgi:hypothetical protein
MSRTKPKTRDSIVIALTIKVERHKDRAIKHPLPQN